MVAVSEQEYITRVKALERQCAALSAQVDRQGRVVEAAIARVESLEQIHPDGLTSDEVALVEAVRLYLHEIAELTGEG